MSKEHSYMKEDIELSRFIDNMLDWQASKEALKQNTPYAIFKRNSVRMAIAYGAGAEVSFVTAAVSLAVISAHQGEVPQLPLLPLFSIIGYIGFAGLTGSTAGLLTISIGFLLTKENYKK